jgi:hypothetical protein
LPEIAYIMQMNASYDGDGLSFMWFKVISSVEGMYPKIEFYDVRYWHKGQSGLECKSERYLEA